MTLEWLPRFAPVRSWWCDVRVDAWLEVSLEEYKTLRGESAAGIEQIQRTFQIGVVALGVIAGFAADAAGTEPATGSELAVLAGLILGAPLLAALVVAIGLDELRRVIAAGAHVAGLEERVAECLGTAAPDTWLDAHGAGGPFRSGKEGGRSAPPLTWETMLRQTPPETRWTSSHWVRTYALFAASLPAVVLGLFRVGEAGEWELFAGSLAAVVVVVATTFYLQRIRGKTLSQIRQKALEDPHST